MSVNRNCRELDARSKRKSQSMARSSKVQHNGQTKSS